MRRPRGRRAARRLGSLGMPRRVSFRRVPRRVRCWFGLTTRRLRHGWRLRARVAPLQSRQRSVRRVRERLRLRDSRTPQLRSHASSLRRVQLDARLRVRTDVRSHHPTLHRRVSREHSMPDDIARLRRGAPHLRSVSRRSRLRRLRDRSALRYRERALRRVHIERELRAPDDSVRSNARSLRRVSRGGRLFARRAAVRSDDVAMFAAPVTAILGAQWNRGDATMRRRWNVMAPWIIFA